MTVRFSTIRASAIGAAVFAVTALHVALLLAPDAIVRWNRARPRLLILEAIGFVAGVVCSIASVERLWRRLFDPAADGDRSIVETVTLTLVLVGTLSGLAVGAGYRWASSWSVVTLTPFVASLVRLAPRTELIESIPFAVRLHLFCAFPLAALVVLTRVGSLVQAAFDRLFDRVFAIIGQLRTEDMWREEEN